MTDTHPGTDEDSFAVADARATLYDAGAVRTPPWLAVVAGLASIRPDSIGATIEWLVAHREELEHAYTEGRSSKLGAATVPPAMQYEPELGYLDRPNNDHALRGKYLFADLAGKRTFFQAAVYAITGREIDSEQAAMLEEFGITNLLVDRRAWPMAVTRRVGARGRDYTSSVIAGAAMMGSPVLAGAAAADCARFLQRARAAELAGRPVAELVQDLLARHQRIMGFGRPVVGPDERVPVTEALLARYGRNDLPYVNLLRATDDAIFAHKRLRSTAAAWAAAILLDLGLTPDQVHAVSNYWVHVNVYAQAIYSVERGLIDQSSP